MTANEIFTEVRYQVAEYDICENDAVENVADMLDRKWIDVWDTYWAEVRNPWRDR